MICTHDARVRREEREAVAQELRKMGDAQDAKLQAMVDAGGQGPATSFGGVYRACADAILTPEPPALAAVIAFEEKYQ